MAKIVQTIDDYEYAKNDKLIPADETIEFSVGNFKYTLDLTFENANIFREAMQEWIDIAEASITPKRPSKAKTSDPVKWWVGQTTEKRAIRDAIREWGAFNGWQIPKNQKIPDQLAAEYELANGRPESAK